jgi:DegV family protein with EDD domain
MSDFLHIATNTRLIVDSSSNVPVELLQRHNMIEVPALVNFGAESLRNNVDISTAEFYQRFAQSATIPTTSQPPPAFFAEAYAQAFAQGAEHLLVFAITSKLSGTYASAQMAARQFDAARITVWDSNAASIGSGWQVIAAARRVEAGVTHEALMAELEKIRSATFAFAALETLKYAALSGRVSNLQAGIGDILQIKAILEMRDGLFIAAGRARGRQRSIEELVERWRRQAGNRPLHLAVAHANSPADAVLLTERARQALNVVEMMTVDIGPAIAALAGPGALALLGYPID